MSRVTLVWVSKDRSSSRTVSLPKGFVYAAVFGCLFSLLASASLMYWAKGLYGENVLQNERNRILETELVEKEELLKSHELTAQELRAENRRVTDELHEIQATENKIRRFLGLNERPLEIERSNQGGMGPTDDLLDPRLDLMPTGAVPGEPEREFSDHTQSLHGGLQEVLAHLDEKLQESYKIPMLLPAASEKAWLSCDFGWRKEPFSGAKREFHNGIDVAGPWKSPIIAPADGKVLQVGKDRLLGVYIKIQHSPRVKTLYGHLESASVKQGARVKRGDVIATMGNTGRSTGTHLHYSVAVEGKYVDPLDFVLDRPFRTLKL